jgi:hypothetical protein
MYYETSNACVSFRNYSAQNDEGSAMFRQTMQLISSGLMNTGGGRPEKLLLSSTAESFCLVLGPREPHFPVSRSVSFNC